MNLLKKSGLTAIMGLFAFSLTVSNVAKAESNPFANQVLTTFTTDDTKDGKCGEGKCGESKDKSKGKAKDKCGEGKCGETKGKGKAKDKCGEGKCGETKAKGKAKDKCGEGKCGETKGKIK